MTDIVRLFCLPVAEAISRVQRQYAADLQEIRLRAGSALSVNIGGRNWFVSPEGGLLEKTEGALRIDWDMVQKCVEFMSGSSLYAFENEIQNGYITLEGGHRVGMVGRAVVHGGRVTGIHPIAGLNLRLAHEVKGCAAELLPRLLLDGDPGHTLILSPPGGGKTTLLRDLIRLMSDELGRTVAVADERSELAGSYRGIPQCDVGQRTDVLDGCPKAEGMLMLLRAMSPQVMAVDELGGAQEMAVVEQILHAGVTLLCTAHGASLEEAGRRLGPLMQRSVFERIVVLSGREGAGTVEAVYARQEDGSYGVV